MEKTVFLFRRKASRTRAGFRRHYIETHAPLGARLTRCLLGYTVNIVETEGGPDAVTEHWLPAAMDLLTPETAYASREDFEAVVADDRSLFDSFELYVVDREVEVVPGDPSNTRPGQASPGVKLIWFYADASQAPPPPPWARRVVDNHVREKLVFAEEGGRKAIAPEFSLIRMAWAQDPATVGSGADAALVVTEYRQIPAPAWR